MKFLDYMKDHQITLLICFAGSFFFAVLLLFLGISLSEIVLLWICFAGIASFTIFGDFWKKQKRIQYLLGTMDSLDQKYLIAEIADRPETEIENIYFRLMKTAMKSMTDEVSEVRRINLEYKDFIEQWIHEIKIPLTGIQLICENNKTEIMRKVITQTEYIKNRLVLFRSFTAKIHSSSIIMGILSVLFMLSLTFMGAGTAVYIIADKNIEQSVFDIMILHKAETQDFSAYENMLSRNLPVKSSYAYSIYTDNKKSFLTARSNVISGTGRSGYMSYAEYQHDTYMKQSDYKKLREILGLPSVELNPSFSVISTASLHWKSPLKH